jgi:hypothetical protein
MKKILTIISLLMFVIFTNSFLPEKIIAQPTHEQLSAAVNKYWHYRDRLKYFWVPSVSNPGDGLVAGIRNTISAYPWDDQTQGDRGLNFEFGEEAVYMGYFLGVLATEYYILSINNKNTDQTLTDIYYLLNAYILNMDECEVECYGLSANSFDGYFVRGGFPDDYFSLGDPYSTTNLDKLNVGLTPNNIFNSSTGMFDGSYPGAPSLNPGQPGWANHMTPTRINGHGCEPMSQDQAIGLLTGLALVAKFIPEGLPVYDNNQLLSGFDINLTAKEITYKIVHRIAYTLHDGFYFKIIDPAGDYIGTSSGGNAYYLSRGFVFAATFITGLDTNNFNVAFSNKGVWQLYPQTGTLVLSHILNIDKSECDWMVASLAAIGDSWGDYPYPNHGYNFTGGWILNTTFEYTWDPFYVLLWAVLHNRYSDDVVQLELTNYWTKYLLINAPCEGPYCYTDDVFDPNGWCTSYRWHSNVDEQTYGNHGYKAPFRGNYNGLDYMLFLNLYLIASDHAWLEGNRQLGGEEFPYLNAYGHFVGDASYPVYTVSPNTIESDTRFYNHLVGTTNYHVANGTYKSQSQIVLKPGFRVEEGSYFHGYIDGDLCLSGYKNMVQNDESEYPQQDTITSKKLNAKNEIDKGITLFPNPSIGVFTLQFIGKIMDNPQIQIYNTIGNMVLEKNLNTLQSQQLDLCTLSEGIYYLRVFNKEQSFSEKIVIQK